VKSARAVALAGLPGLLLATAALLGWSPSARDLPAYFLPLRARTAEVLEGSRGPFWNPDVGCGEPYFANPQTGLLYPPAWLATLLPARTAVGVEVGLHLALLGWGCALLARRLGARGWLCLAAGWGAVLAGPTADAAGVLNNLDALAWLPWAWWAALEGGPARTAVFLAAAYLAGEPQLAALGGAVALSLAPSRRTLAALALGVGLIAVQLLPFGVWVHGGDRGPGTVASEAAAGAVRPAELAALAAPGAALPQRAERYVDHLAVPVWALLLGILALARPGRSRVLAAWGVVLLVAAVLAGAGWGRVVWTLLTAGLLRYPGRLVFPALIALLPAAAAVAEERRSRWAGVVVAVVLGGVGLLAGGDLLPTAIEAIATGFVVAGAGAGVAGVVAALALAPASLLALGLTRGPVIGPASCLDAQRGPFRVYTVQPSARQVAWVMGDEPRRAATLGWGYSSLLDGRRMVRTFAPLEAGPLAAHLAAADRGPAGRWWLDTLAAQRIVSFHPVAGFPEECREGDLRVLENPAAWPQESVVRALPAAGEPPVLQGTVLDRKASDDRMSWRVWVGKPGGVLLWLATPDRGWRFTVDGVSVGDRRGPGILHGVPVAAGEHLVVARYRPPLVLLGGAFSLLALGLLLGEAWRRL
jgi:hypothetical protein